jgi:hypothetical protein
MNVIDALTNGVLLGEQWRIGTDALNPGLAAKMGMTGTLGWILVDFVLGIPRQQPRGIGRCAGRWVRRSSALP